MSVGLGLASSHAPGVWLHDPDDWETMFHTLSDGIVQPPETALETPDVIRGILQRTDAALARMREELEAYGPDALIIIGGDQTEMFDDSNKPQIMIYLGDETWGSTAQTFITGRPMTDEESVTLPIDRELSERLLKALVVDEGFDVSYSTEAVRLGRNPKGGIPHAFSNPAPVLMPKLDIPVVVVYVNTYDPPCLSAERCYELGQAITRIFKREDKRIAIYGSGGLSHDPRGPRSGWVDEVLDRWVLDQISSGNGKALKSLYKFDSMTMVGGTGEIRSWIVVAGAMDEAGQSEASVLDYVAARKAVTGLGFAYWPAIA